MRCRIATAGLLAGIGLITTSAAQAMPFENYLKPAPIACSPLSSATWGVAGVLPRDTCMGIESAKGAAVPPDYYYWDGQIIRAKDGKYHMFMSTWAGSAGFNPGWTGSDAYHAISSQGVQGPYMRQDYVYTNGGSHKGHNVSALELLDGSYAVVVSEIVPFTIYKAASLDGPWTGCTASIQTNGIKTQSTTTCPPGGACNDTHYDSNVSLVARPDGKFEIVQRHGFIAIASSLCGPYAMQKPTWTYPQANLPNVDSVYPKRTSIPGVTNPSYGWEEDPHIWYSAGTYHVIYSGSQDRVGYHLYSSDGLTNWKDNGYAWSPRDYQKIFCYEGSTTCNQWYKMERPGVVLENGHPTHITWAVADVDKDNQIPAGSNHGSKVIVVPFDGVTFDADFGSSGSAGTGGGAGGSGGATGAGGRGGTGGTGGGGGSGATGGRGGAGGVTGSGGRGGGSAGTGGGGVSGSAGTTGNGGTGGLGGAGGPGGSSNDGGPAVDGGGTGVGGVAGGSAGAAGSTGSGSGGTTGGPGGSGAAGTGSGAGGTGAGGTTGGATGETGGAAGCGCATAGAKTNANGALLLLGLSAVIVARRRRR